MIHKLLSLATATLYQDGRLGFIISCSILKIVNYFVSAYWSCCWCCY